MGYTKHQFLDRLKELQVDFVGYDHPVVLTVDEALKYLPDESEAGAFCKNLFLKDKKQRFYIISALKETKVDLKVLSVRLGLGKGGLRMAPEDALADILQVPLGCVTPFAIINDSARNVSLLLDQRLRSKKCILFHPLCNDMSIALSADGLDKFLKSLGRDPAYVDLEANPPIGKDCPPDLAGLAPSSAIVVPESATKLASAEVLQNSQSINANSGPVTVKAKEKSVTKKSVEGTVVKPSTSPTIFSNSQLFVDELLDKTSALILSEINKETISKHGEQLGSVASENVRKLLHSELSHLAMVYKNTAYTEGFHAGSHHRGPCL